MGIYDYELRHDADGRIIGKTETVNGKPLVWAYTYDEAGRLYEAHLDGRLVCQCHYDKQGRRSQDYFPMSAGSHVRNYSYTMDNRLTAAGNNSYTHNENGFRTIWNNEGKYTTYEYAPDHRLLCAEKEDEGVAFEFEHDDNGQRAVKYRNGEIMEAYVWLDLVRLAGFHDGEFGWCFVYEDDETRTPYAMQHNDGAIAYLYYDQVGSLRVVADASGNVIKEVLYDPFGGIIEDSNPDFRIPLGFAGGLHDRDLGFVRFGWRDYDTFTSRWTAPDPMGDAGGDPDWYGYCLDDPVNGVDPLGQFALMGIGVAGLLAGARVAGAYGPTVMNAARVYGPTIGNWVAAKIGTSMDGRPSPKNIPEIMARHRREREKKEKAAAQARRDAANLAIQAEKISKERERDRDRNARRAVDAAAKNLENDNASNGGNDSTPDDMSNFRNIAASYSAGKDTRGRSGYGGGGHGASGNTGDRGGSYNDYGR